MTDKLAFYNLTLGHLLEQPLLSLTERSEKRYALDTFYDQVVKEALEAGLWKFMLRVVKYDASATLKPDFGFTYGFAIPNDWVRTEMVSLDPTFSVPLKEYAEETGYWYANSTPIYVKFQSNDALYGMNLGEWSGTFTKYASLLFAEYACGRVTGATKLLAGPEGISRRLDSAKKKAKSNDAMGQPLGQMPTSSWVNSRQGMGRINGPNGIGLDD